ncbi:MAG: hypothetical protein AAF716_18305 [Cyanobacteria bacterium P01_D01_bin.1]
MKSPASTVSPLKIWLSQMSVEIQAAIISGVFNLASALIAAIAAATIGKAIGDRRKLKETLKTATDDIAFLLEVEALHCDRNKQETGQSLKNTVREEVRELGLNFSGKLTPGRVRANRTDWR